MVAIRSSNCPIGDYKVSAEKERFQQQLWLQIHLDLNQSMSGRPLEVGSITQQVIVEANQVQVEMTAPQLGAVIDANQIANMLCSVGTGSTCQQLQARCGSRF